MTQPFDRDAALDRMLRSMPADDSGAGTDCLDAEAAAALVDGGLALPERSAFMAHAAACRHCQALLAAVIRTAPPPAPAHAWWRIHPWRWLAPVVATGLAVTLWVAVDRSGPRVTVVPLPAPAAANNEAVPVPAQPAEPKPSLDPLARKALDAAARPLGQSVDTVTPAAPPSRDTSRAESPVETRADTSQRVPTAQSFAAERPATPLVVGGAPAPAPPASASAGQPETVAGERRASATPPPPPSAPLPPAAVNETVRLLDRTAPGAAGGVLKTGGAPPAIAIASTDPRVRWRIVGNAVEHSADGGATWTPQAIGVSVRLYGGSAPLPEVCWIVGDAGTVVVTADGLSWTTVPFPVNAPLVSVTATSADTATVTTSDGRVFTTVDRGRTWTGR